VSHQQNRQRSKKERQRILEFYTCNQTQLVDFACAYCGGADCKGKC